MYKGKEVCPGCNISGESKRRESKASVCYDCKEAIRVGNSIIALEEKQKHVRMCVRWYSLQFNTGDYGGKLIETCFTNLFKTLHFDFATGGGVDLTTGSATTASNSYNIRRDIYESLKELVNALELQQRDFRAQVDSYRTDLNKEYKENKNKIYNEGIEKGRELLFSLNAGTITMEDFAKEIKRY